MPPDGAEFPHHVPRGISLSSQLFGRPHRCHESWHTPTSPPTPNSKPPRPWGTSSPVRYRPFRYGSNACPPNGAMGQKWVKEDFVIISWNGQAFGLKYFQVTNTETHDRKRSFEKLRRFQRRSFSCICAQSKGGHRGLLSCPLCSPAGRSRSNYPSQAQRT